MRGRSGLLNGASTGMIGHLGCGVRSVVWSRRSSKLRAFACVLALLLPGCQRPATALVVTIEHEVSPLPARSGPATIALRVSDVSGHAVTGARIRLEANMSHPGMAPVFAEAKETEPGRYQAHLEFTMAGDWIVLVNLIMSDGRKLEQQFEIKGVR